MAAAVQNPNPVPPSFVASTSSATELPRIRSNEGDYVQSAGVGSLKASPRDTPIEELRRRFREEGYIWLKNLIPREDVLDMRECYFRRFDDGMLKPGTSPRDAIFNDAEDPMKHCGVGSAHFPEDKKKVDTIVGAHHEDQYLKFLEHDALRSFIREFMGWEKEVIFKRTMLRHNVPNGLSTGIHYDKLFMRGGEADFLTAWVPIGDCSANGGGLLYLEGSSALGKEIEDDFTERAKDFTEEERIFAYNQHMTSTGSIAQDAELFAQGIETGKWQNGGKRPRWLIADYEAGDVVFHDPYMIHGTAMNEDKDGRIRLSTDLRFIPEGAPGDMRWMRSTWYPGDGL